MAKALVLCLFSLLVALMPVAPAEAAWPGGNGAIAFSRSSSVQSSSDIWVQTRSGKQQRLTATTGIDETSPTFSQDGRWIAYVRRADEDSDIWLMRSDGSDKRVVVDSEIDEFQPSFYPGGRSLVFATYDGEQGWNVFSVLNNGEGLKRQVINATYPVISPDGRWLAYSQNGAGGGIRLRDNLHGGKVRTSPPAAPRNSTSRRTGGGSSSPGSVDADRATVTCASRSCRSGCPGTCASCAGAASGSSSPPRGHRTGGGSSSRASSPSAAGCTSSWR